MMFARLSRLSFAGTNDNQWKANVEFMSPTMNKQKNVLRVATCQFAVEPAIAHNRRWMLKQLRQAAESHADVVHFSETALSGYAGVDIPDINTLDGEELRAAT